MSDLVTGQKPKDKALVITAHMLAIFFRIPILGGITWSHLTGSTDDDWIDRVSHLWSVCLLLMFAVLVSSGQYVGDPIHCWCPAEFTGKQK